VITKPIYCAQQLNLPWRNESTLGEKQPEIIHRNKRIKKGIRLGWIPFFLFCLQIYSNWFKMNFPTLGIRNNTIELLMMGRKLLQSVNI